MCNVNGKAVFKLFTRGTIVIPLSPFFLPNYLAESCEKGRHEKKEHIRWIKWHQSMVNHASNILKQRRETTLKNSRLSQSLKLWLPYNKDDLCFQKELLLLFFKSQTFKKNKFIFI